MRDVIVLDAGTQSTKAGFSGESVPRLITPTVVGYVYLDEETRYVGSEALARRSKVKITQPIRQGRIQNWEDIEQVWRETLEVELKIDPELHPVLLTESTQEHVRNRERKAEIFFESLRVPQFSIATQSVLALHAEGLTSGVVVDIGAGHAAVVPVLEGKLMSYALEQMSASGDELTRQLLVSLKQFGFREDLQSHWDIANHIKETMCRVDLDTSEQFSLQDPSTAQQYTLPDHTTISLSPSQLSLPSSLLLGPNSVQSAFSRSVSKLCPDIRTVLSRQVVLSGGSTDCPGLETALFEKLGETAPTRKETVQRGAGRVKSWVGGSVLASLPSFTRMSVLRSEYEETGPGLINRRCRMEDGADTCYGLYGFYGS